MSDFVPKQRNAKKAFYRKLETDVDAEAVKFGGVAADATQVKNAAKAIADAMDETDAADATCKGKRATERNLESAQLVIIRARVRNWKTLSGWAASGSEAVLGLKGVGVPFDPATYKPLGKARVLGGIVVIDFEKNGVDSVKIYARLRGALGWTSLATDSEAPYFDTRPLAQPGVPETREFMLRGMIGDDEIGLDSDIISVTFGGS